MNSFQVNKLLIVCLIEELADWTYHNYSRYLNKSHNVMLVIIVLQSRSFIHYSLKKSCINLFYYYELFEKMCSHYIVKSIFVEQILLTMGGDFDHWKQIYLTLWKRDLHFPSLYLSIVNFPKVIIETLNIYCLKVISTFNFSFVLK